MESGDGLSGKAGGAHGRIFLVPDGERVERLISRHSRAVGTRPMSLEAEPARGPARTTRIIMRHSRDYYIS
eukprot:8179106-Pyramimonas_sp.AAC.1